MEKNMFYDKGFRNKVRDLNRDSLAQVMADYTSDARIKVLTNTKDTTYFVIPTSSSYLGAESIQAGTALGADCFACLASLGSASSTISTGGTASTIDIRQTWGTK